MSVGMQGQLKLEFDHPGGAYQIKDIVKGRYYYPKGAGARFREVVLCVVA